MALESMTYLDIVNRAVVESRVSLDELTEENFAAPPRTILYSQFKNWVNDAYIELMQDHPEWFFRKERALATVYPRLFLTDVLGTIEVGDILLSDVSEIPLAVVGVYSEIEGTEADEVTIEFTSTLPTHIPDLIRGETLSKTYPVEVSAMATVTGAGRYTFTELVSTLGQVDPDTIRVHPLVDDPIPHYGTLRDNNFPVRVVPYYSWAPEYDLYPWTSGYPTYITETDQGNYAIFPQPTEGVMLSFSYTRELNKMELASDIPEAMPTNQQMYLVWKAVEEYADFDNNPVLFRRAKKHLTKYENYLFRESLPQLKWAPSLFNRS